VSRRLDAIDVLRGLVMVLMLLDHARDFFDDVFVNPTDPATTTPALYVTRWVTHLCAPTFVFLAGAGAYLAGRGRTRSQLAGFLLTRGLWLIVLEFAYFRIFFTGGDLTWRFTPLQVIWVIGVSMVVLAGLVWLPRAAVLAVGLALVAGHNLFDGVAPERFGRWGWLWQLLHVWRAVIEVAPGVRLFVMYPLVPWVGVMAAGYAFGPVLELDRPARRRTVLALGAVLLTAFVVLRWRNVYGDPNPWAVQERGPLYTLFAFLNLQKYPPSLSYLLVTLGLAMLILAAADREPGPLGRVLATYGRVPLFFYILHLPLLFAGAAATWAVGHALGYYGTVAETFPPNAPGLKVGLPAVYLITLGAALLLYFPCRWFAGVKRRSRSVWLSYL
jgi:uncharacterized membrane protein